MGKSYLYQILELLQNQHWNLTIPVLPVAAAQECRPILEIGGSNGGLTPQVENRTGLDPRQANIIFQKRHAYTIDHVVPRIDLLTAIHLFSLSPSPLTFCDWAHRIHCVRQEI